MNEDRVVEQLTCFFYLLLRDGLPAGEVVRLLQETERFSFDGSPGFRAALRLVYTEKGLEVYARELAERLLDGPNLQELDLHPQPGEK